jgi:peptidyl-prolyl cis-trans isomerase D
MFGTIRKHQTWLWAIIITLTIISFVIFFSPYSKIDSGRGGSRDHGTIYGKKVTDQEFINAWKEAHLHQFVMNGQWPDDSKQTGFDAEQQAYQWVLLVRKQQQLGIEVSDEAATRAGKQIISAFQRIGVGSPQMFFDKLLTPRGYTADDFERFVRHFVGIQEMISATGLGGTLIPPAEVNALYQRDNQEVATEAAFFWASNFIAGVTATPEILGQYYSNRVATYAVPERVQVDYVRFDVTNQLTAAQATLTNLAELVDVNFARLGTNAFPDAKTPDEAKAKLREQIIRQQAMFMVRSNALQFANQLFAMTPAKSENLKFLAASNNLPVLTSQPFDRDTGPLDLPVGKDFPKAAFNLNVDEPYSQVIAGQDGAYIMALNKTLPRETPTLDQIRPRVEADFKRMQSMMLAQQAARTFHQTLTNGLAQGKPFAELCTAANVKPLDLPPFAISTRSLPQVEDVVPLNQLKQAAFTTSPSNASPVFGFSEGAAILFVKAKLPLDAAKMQTNLPAYTAQLRRSRQQEAFNNWLRRESEQGLRETSLSRPQSSPKAGSGTSKS